MAYSQAMVLVSGALFLLGLAAGALVARLLAGSRLQEPRARAEAAAAELAEKNRQLETQLQTLRERDSAQREQIARFEESARQVGLQIAELRTALDRSESEKEQHRREAHLAQLDAAGLRIALEKDRTAAAEKIALLQQAEKALSDRFETLANDILEKKSKTFTDQNQANLTNLLTPLREKFGEFQVKVESLEKDSVAGRSELKEQINNLRSLNERLSQDASNLVTALKGSSKTQGDWGEFILEKLLESAGLREGHEYRLQESFTRDDRSRARPDVILDLPGNRHLVIDAKVSLDGYDEYCAGAEEPVREAALSRHIASMRAHIRELSSRNYHALYDLNSLDFAILFVPIEPAFMLALAHDGKLWQEAWDRNVLLVSRTTLLFVLRTVSQLWRQEQQTRNVQEIVRRGGELYDKLAAFAKDLTDIDKSLHAARQSYDEAYRKLATGKGNAIRQAEMLKALGVKPTKTLPLALVERAAEDESPLEFAAMGDETSNGH